MAAELYTHRMSGLVADLRSSSSHLEFVSSFLFIQVLWTHSLALFELPSLLYTQLLPLVECIYTTRAHLQIVSHRRSQL